MLTAAGPVEPKPGKTNVAMEKVGLFFIQTAVTTKDQIGNQAALDAAKTEQQRTAVKLGDFYLKALRYDKARAVFERVVNEDPPFAPVPAALGAYCIGQTARTYAADQTGQGKAMGLLKRLYDPKYAKEPTSAMGLVMLGALVWANTHSAPQAIQHLDYVCKTFPDHPQAERALYFCCITANQVQNWKLAADDCHAYLDKYPTGSWVQNVSSMLSKIPASDQQKTGGS
jgi:tetratricopeptide (TPR) repeat protein